MNSQMVVKTEEIRNIARNIDNKRETIYNIYKSDVVSILNSSRECIKISGLNYDEFMNSFNDLFNSLNEQLKNLSDIPA